MKIVLAETPETINRDVSVEKQFLPKDAEIKTALFTEENKAEFYKEIADADGIMTTYIKFNKEALDAMKRCKVISCRSTGWNSVDAEYAKEKGIAVCAVGEYCTQEVADMALMFILALTKGIISHNRSVQQDKAWRCDLVPVRRLDGMVLGIVGLGKIGKAVAKRAQAFGMRVVAYDPYIPKKAAEEIDVELLSSMDGIYDNADIISIHMNMTDENKAFFTLDKFEKMKKKPYIINVARGALINENDLARALDLGLLSGAGLDVLESEEPDLPKCKLLGRENVIITPHCAFYSDTSVYLSRKIAAENITNCVSGDYKRAFRVVNGVGL